jgi:hypothetical protein
MTDLQLIIAVSIPSVSALVGLIGVFTAILVNNSRLGDVNSRLSDMNSRIDDLRNYIDTCLSDHQKVIQADARLIMDKLDSLDRRLTDLEDRRR